MTKFETTLREVCQEVWDRILREDPSIPEKISFEGFVSEVWSEAEEQNIPESV